MAWYTFRYYGDPALTAKRGRLSYPPAGPFKSVKEAEEALNRWRERLGCIAGTVEAAHGICLLGPFTTREAARRARN